MTKARTGIARGGVVDTVGLMRDLLLPTIGKGVLRRRPAVVGALERTGYEERSIRRLQALRRKHGARPVLLSFFGRKQLVVLSPKALLRVLHETPDDFLSTSDEKSSALAHFEPGVSLISDGIERQVRRDFNGRVLDEDCPSHRMAGHFSAVVRQEVGEILDRLSLEAGQGAEVTLTWERYFDAWNRIVRRVLLGDGARGDERLTKDLEKLRAAGNWAFLHPGRGKLRRDFHERLEHHLARAEWHSLAGLVPRIPGHTVARPVDQFTHYMFAFDPGGMATFRALALLASHPGTLADIRGEMASDQGSAMPLLRASILESLRLWPTTPVILRQTRHDIDWEGDTVPGGTQVVIFAPFFHRDDETVDQAHRFAPELWPEGRPLRDSPFVPFSEGDGICPARDLVPMVGSMVLAELLGAGEVRLSDPDRLDPDRPLPPTLDNYTLEFSLRPKAA